MRASTWTHAQDWQGSVCASKHACCDIQVRGGVTYVLRKTNDGLAACAIIHTSAAWAPLAMWHASAFKVGLPAGSRATHYHISSIPLPVHVVVHWTTPFGGASRLSALCLADGDALTSGRAGHHAWLRAGAGVRARSAPARAGGSALGTAMHVQRERLRCAAPGAPPTAARCPPDAPCLPPRQRCLSTC